VLPKLAIFAILILTLAAFVVGRWRYDVISMGALLAGVLVGVVPGDRAFVGFGHPAVVTVAAVLILSRAIQNSGVMDSLTSRLATMPANVPLQVGIITALVTVASAFMNNVGALALMLPVVLHITTSTGTAPSMLFMPLAFGSMLGGMCTLIGTPPNIIISAFYERNSGEPLAMFDFAPVGIVIAVVGVVFLALIGWRFIPVRRQSMDAVVDSKVSDYTAELRIPRGAEFAGKTIRELEELTNSDCAVLALVRRKKKNTAPDSSTKLAVGDRLLVQVDPVTLKQLIDLSGLKLLASPASVATDLTTENVRLAEVLVRPGSVMEGRTAGNLRLHGRFGVNLVAISRTGRPVRDHIGRVKFRRGDVLLLQGRERSLRDAVSELDGISLGRLDIKYQHGKQYVVPAIFGVAVLVTALGIFPVQIALIGAVFAVVALRRISLAEVYKSIDWPIAVLLAAMIPLGEALETTGAAHSVASLVALLPSSTPAFIFIGLLMVLSIALSNLVNNAATALLMAPIALDLATALGFSAMPFFMAVAVGSSAAFMTPIGHQSNLLVMGPGGYKFGDYWKLGLPLSVLVVVVATPAIIFFWPA
jgi:di/tricarboxylate transporter